jgi:hypothetical protein
MCNSVNACVPVRGGLHQALLTLLALLLVLSPVSLRAEDATSAAAAEKRLYDSARYLASDDLEGRGVGTKGLELAAEYVAEQFRSLGLKTELFDGTPFQKFKMTTGAELGKKNEALLAGPPDADGKPQRVPLKLGQDFNPLALGGSGRIDLPLVFAGYGITAKDEKYDDYAGIDVDGKAVIVLRHEPQQNNPHSAFNGTKDSQYAPLVRKISNAYEHGAAAVIFVTDDYDIKKNVADRRKRWQEALDKLAAAYETFKAIESPTVEQTKQHVDAIARLNEQVRTQTDLLSQQFDPVLNFKTAGTEGPNRQFPVLHVRRSVLDPLVQSALGMDLAALEREIDKGPTPQSREIPGWKIAGEITVIKTEAEVRNVAAVLEGEGSLAHETIVIGAHYDHVGLGGPGSGSLDPNSREVHNGADDNGSGTATLIEVARSLAQQASLRDGKPRRRILLMAFTAEERGLIGSAQYTKAPLFKLEDTVAMLNMDMVGRLADEKLIVEGVGTATQFEPLVDRFNESYGFKLTKKPGGFGPSDHASFYAKQIPVMHFFTGTHKDYHRPGDDYDKLNVPGMRRIGGLVSDLALALAESPDRPTYQQTRSPAGRGGGGDRPYFGSIPDFAQTEPGYAITGVTKGSPAERGGLKGGDIMIQFGESKIGGLEDFDSALRKYKAGDRVPIVVRRDGKEVKLEVTLDPPR